MNSINFINPLPPEKEREIIRWYRITILLIVAILIGITITSLVQWHLYRTIKKEANTLQQEVFQFNAVMEQKRTHRAHKEQLEKQLNTVMNYQSSPQNPLDQIIALQKAAMGSSIQTLTITPNDFELQISCNSAEQASNCIRTLTTQKLFTKTRLVSLKTDHNDMMAIIKGSIKQRQ